MLFGEGSRPLWMNEVDVTALEATSHRLWRTEKIESGVVFGPGQVCLDVLQDAAISNSSMGHGYLIDMPTE